MTARLLRDSFGEWLHKYEWDWFITLTFRNKQSLETAKHSFIRFIRGLKSDGNYFMVIEDGHTKHNVHIHALLGNMGNISMQQILLDWKNKNGIAQVGKYDEQLGARYYITKCINNDKIDWDIEIKENKLRKEPEKDPFSDVLEDL